MPFARGYGRGTGRSPLSRAFTSNGRAKLERSGRAATLWQTLHPTLEVISSFTGIEGDEMVDSCVTETAPVTAGARDPVAHPRCVESVCGNVVRLIHSEESSRKVL
jgi:hypothetical protein